MRVGIIGAGPAGVTVAYELSKAGVAVELFESGSSVGGMSRTLQLCGQKVDLGPHRFFSNDARVNRIWSEVAGSEFDWVDRHTRILSKGKLYDYPLRPINALLNLGPIEASRCLASYAKERCSPTALGEAPTFEEWVISRFGRRLFEIFFKTYSEKLWGVRCSELDADFAAQRIKKFSLQEAIMSAFGLAKVKHKTLVDQFAYPHGGTGSIYERMSRRCEERGGIVHLNAPVQRVVVEQSRAIGLELVDGTVKPFDHVVSSMPVTTLVTRMERVPQSVVEAAGRLRFRNTLLVYLRVQGSGLFRDNWLYVHSTELATGRITNFRNWTPHLYGANPDTVLALEYWCYSNDETWRMSDTSLVNQAREEIEKSGLLRGRKVLEGHVVRLENAYPVYAHGYKEPLSIVREYLKTIEGLTAIGRYGTFKYNNQDHSILMGHLAAGNICAGATCDLWEINTDYEYQEASAVRDSELKKG